MKKAQVIPSLILGFTLIVPSFYFAPKFTCPTKSINNIEISQKFQGACVKTSSQIIDVKGFWIEPNMEYIYLSGIALYYKLFNGERKNV